MIPPSTSQASWWKVYFHFHFLLVLGIKPRALHMQALAVPLSYTPPSHVFTFLIRNGASISVTVKTGQCLQGLWCEEDNSGEDALNTFIMTVTSDYKYSSVKIKIKVTRSFQGSSDSTSEFLGVILLRPSRCKHFYAPSPCLPPTCHPIPVPIPIPIIIALKGI
jgi:hypothetical protein